MKLQHIAAAALALTAFGSANAAIATGANGSLVLIAYDKSAAGSFNNVAGVFDLGVSIDDLIGAASTATASTAGSLDGQGKKLDWDLTTGGLKINDSISNAYGAFNYGAAWNTLVNNVDANNFSFVVTAFDTVGFGAGLRSIVTGSNAAANFNSTQAANLNLIGGGKANDIFTPLNGNNVTQPKGTHGTADNGAYTFTTADGAASRANGYAMAGDGFGTEWRSNNVLLGETLVANTTVLWMVNANTTPAKYKIGDVTLNAQTGVLTLTTAVPEPTTYALLITGLAVVGAAARRRRAA